MVGLETPEDSKWDHAESLQELGELVKSAGGEVVETAIQRRPAPTAAYYIGPGKATELAELCKKENVGTVIFNDELSPAQSRNLEKIFERKILDRTQLILDIFAQRAKSKDGKLQIELAQACYMDEDRTSYDETRATPLRELLQRLVTALLQFSPAPPSQ